MLCDFLSMVLNPNMMTQAAHYFAEFRYKFGSNTLWSINRNRNVRLLSLSQECSFCSTLNQLFYFFLLFECLHNDDFNCIKIWNFDCPKYWIKNNPRKEKKTLFVNKYDDRIKANENIKRDRITETVQFPAKKAYNSYKFMNIYIYRYWYKSKFSV